MDHPYGKPAECEWRGIIMRLIYLFTKVEIDCPLIPESLDVTDTEKFSGWLTTNPKDFPDFEIHNGLKLFLWIITDYIPLFEDSN